MDYAARLSSDSLKSQVAAAVFLKAEGSNGYRYLPALLAACKKVDRSERVLLREQESLLTLGARSMGSILKCVGFDAANEFHNEILDWLLNLSKDESAELSAGAIYGLGDLGVPPNEVRERLCEIARGERCPSDHAVVSRRAIAFRNLSQIDQTAARSIVGSEAHSEFIECIDYWVANASEDRKASLRERLLIEMEWIELA